MAVLLERADVYAGFAKTFGDLRGDLWGAGGVAVDAQGVGVQWHLGAVPGNDFPLHDGQGLLGGFGGIGNERVGVFARAQGALWLITAGRKSSGAGGGGSL